MIRVGLLGAGKIAQIHAEAYQKIEGVQVQAVADIDKAAADALAGRAAAGVFYDIDSLLDYSEIDLVDVCLPTFLHERCVVGAAERGKHILCEKPISLSLESVDRMICSVEKAGVKAMIAQVVRFNPDYHQIYTNVAEGVVGKPLVYYATRRAEMPDWGPWFKDPTKSGGSLFDLHIHDVDYIYSALGLPESVFAMGIKAETGAWNHVVSSLIYPDYRASVECSYMSPAGYPFHMCLRVLGDAGCIEFNYVGGQVDVRDQAQQGVILYRAGEPGVLLPRDGEDGFVSELRYFTDCIKEDRPVQIASLAQARDVLTIIHAIQQSLLTGQVVRLGEAA